MKKLFLLTSLLMLIVFYNSYARVIHRYITPPPYPALPYFPNTVDVDNDGTVDMFTDASSNPQTTFHTCPGPPFNYTKRDESSYFHLKAGSAIFNSVAPSGNLLTAGTTIPTNQTYVSSIYLATLYSIWFTPSNCAGETAVSSPMEPVGQPGYIGFKFTAGTGLVHYGWIYILSNGSAYEVAYESIPGYPIVTGDKTGYLSDINNPTANIVKGKVYVDANGSCSYNAGEKVISGVYVFLSPGNYAALTDENGNYAIYAPGGTSSYTVDIKTEPYPGLRYTKVCPTGVQNAAFTGNNMTVSVNFAVNTAVCGDLSTNISSSRRRRCFRNDTYVDYYNHGTVPAASATVKVIMPQYVRAISSIPAWTIQSGDTLIYNLGSLNAFAKGRIHIIDSVVCGDESIRGLSQCTKAIISPKNYCYNTGNWDESDLFIKAICLNSAFTTFITNSGHNMSDSVSYRIFLDGTLMKTRKIKLAAGQSLQMEIPANGKALHIEVDQHQFHPEVTTRVLNYEGCGNFSTHTISRDFANLFPPAEDRSVSTHCMIIRDAYDPNDKTAVPAGFGSDHNILPDGDIEYTIRFQNTGSAEAYTVVVADTIDANLDMSSLRIIAASHAYRTEISGSSRRILWIFGGINLPDSTTDEPGSHGFVRFRIAQKPGLAVGTTLKNKAYIFFDYNSAILTNEVSHKITDSYPSDLLSVTTQPSGSTFCATGDVSFNTAATGPGTVSYLWYKDNNPLMSNTGQSLSLDDALPADAGAYKCRVSNFIDTVFTNTAQLIINMKPDLQVTDPTAVCNSTVNITNTFSDANATTGTVSYWLDADTLNVLSSPAAVSSSGTYYICKKTGILCADIEPVHVVINSCSSTLDELKNNFNIKIYPNPVTEKLVVEHDRALELEVTDSEGREIVRSRGEVDMKKYPSGTYYLRLNIEGQQYVVPVVKQ